MRIFSYFLDLLLPFRCLGCGLVGTPLCETCLTTLEPAQKHESPWVISCFSYQSPLCKKIIRHLKKHPDTRLVDILTTRAVDTLLGELSDKNIFGSFQTPILIPTPLHVSRFAERGYNQSELITHSLFQKLKPHLPEIQNKSLLEKIRKTEKQALIHHKSDRLRAPTGSIIVPEKHIPDIIGQDCVLIDDVTTTGATLGVAKKALRDKGAKHVIAFTIAH